MMPNCSESSLLSSPASLSLLISNYNVFQFPPSRDMIKELVLSFLHVIDHFSLQCNFLQGIFNRLCICPWCSPSIELHLYSFDNICRYPVACPWFTSVQQSLLSITPKSSFPHLSQQRCTVHNLTRGMFHRATPASICFFGFLHVFGRQTCTFIYNVFWYVKFLFNAEVLHVCCACFGDLNMQNK